MKKSHLFVFGTRDFESILFRVPRDIVCKILQIQELLTPKYLYCHHFQANMYKLLPNIHRESSSKEILKHLDPQLKFQKKTEAKSGCILRNFMKVVAFRGYSRKA